MAAPVIIAVADGRPLLVEHPASVAAEGFRELARRVKAWSER